MNKLRDVTRYISGLLLALGIIGGAVLEPDVVLSQTVPSWTLTGSLSTSRYAHTATLLPNGRVLVVGGAGPNSCLTVTGTAELYDPVSGTWSATGSLNTARASHTATLLQNGQVLVAGGAGGHAHQVSLNSAELYDPATGVWRPTGSFNTIQNGGSATLLPNGKVLAVGGSGSGLVAELYDPITGTWSSTSAPSTSGFTVLLPNGKVLAVWEGSPWDNYWGGLFAELYDPSTGQWSATGFVNGMHFAGTLTLLRNGKVLITGDANQARLYDTTTGTWSITGSLNTSNAYTATLQPDGRVLVAGGNVNAEIYDPTVGRWSSTSRVIVPRISHTGTLLRNGKTLIVGGADAAFLNGCDASILRSAELYDPGSTSTLNPIDDPQFFIRQQYRDFLDREPEPAGLQFYLDILNGCHPADTECIKYTRGALSANFFRSPEFGRKGAYVANLFNIVIGQRPKTVAELNDPTKVERPHYAEFMADLATLSTPNDDPVLTNQKKDQLTSAWLARTEVQAILPGGLSNQQFVQKLESIAGVTLANENTLIANLNNGTQTRAQVLRAIAESNEVVTKFYIPNFVTMEYLGFLRRDPEDCHVSSDPESCGFIFHNRRFNTPGANPDLIENFIVRGFIESPEYRNRFLLGPYDY